MISLLTRYSRHQFLMNPQLSPGAAQRLTQMGSRFFHGSANLQRQAVGPETWDASYTFGLVRNPWSRHVSNFFFLMQEFCGNATLGANRVKFCDERLMPPSGPWMSDPALAAEQFRMWVLASAKAFPLHSPKEHLFASRSHGNGRDPWYNALHRGCTQSVRCRATTGCSEGLRTGLRTRFSGAGHPQKRPG